MLANEHHVGRSVGGGFRSPVDCVLRKHHAHTILPNGGVRVAVAMTTTTMMARTSAATINGAN